jgi:hypothetical protein
MHQLTDICMEDCTPARDYRHVKHTRDCEIYELPRFPLKEFLEEMHPNVSRIVAAIHLAQVVDHLQG